MTTPRYPPNKMAGKKRKYKPKLTSRPLITTGRPKKAKERDIKKKDEKKKDEKKKDDKKKDIRKRDDKQKSKTTAPIRRPSKNKPNKSSVLSTRAKQIKKAPISLKTNGNQKQILLKNSSPKPLVITRNVSKRNPLVVKSQKSKKVMSTPSNDLLTEEVAKKFVGAMRNMLKKQVTAVLPELIKIAQQTKPVPKADNSVSKRINRIEYVDRWTKKKNVKKVNRVKKSPTEIPMRKPDSEKSYPKPVKLITRPKRDAPSAYENQTSTEFSNSTGQLFLL